MNNEFRSVNVTICNTIQLDVYLFQQIVITEGHEQNVLQQFFFFNMLKKVCRTPTHIYDPSSASLVHSLCVVCGRHALCLR